ncbi:MAG: hypothetical protein IT378_15940 [Sandaracinaceae bacterium]|nr:hypothetical protein [Sandaracinaceae bacterium]
MRGPLSQELLRDGEAAREALAEISIECVTLWHPDASLPEAHDPVDFVARLHADRLTVLAPGRTISVPLDEAARTKLVRAARRALDQGDDYAGVDTAIGRYVTHLELRARWPGLQGDAALPTVARLDLNHYGSIAPRPAWAELLGLVASHLDARLDPLERPRGWLERGR